MSPPVDEPDPDEQLITIINHISSETSGAMHKEGITELHHFLKAYPHKKPRVDRLLESTGPAFRKYIARALASRAAEDEERTVAVADTLSSECNYHICPFVSQSNCTQHFQNSNQTVVRRQSQVQWQCETQRRPQSHPNAQVTVIVRRSPQQNRRN
jgi:hypothetical protein